jgi:hypothetical protein
VSIRLPLASIVVLLGVGWSLHVVAQPKPATPGPAAQAGKGAPAPKVGPVAPPTTDADKIKSALAAAPAAISKDATVMDMPSMKVLRKGTNGWTCIPDGPSPGVDPMCLDKDGMAWADA